MSKTRLKSYKASDKDSDDHGHDLKRKKSSYNKKQFRTLDNILKTKNLNKIVDFNENY